MRHTVAVTLTALVVASGCGGPDRLQPSDLGPGSTSRLALSAPADLPARVPEEVRDLVPDAERALVRTLETSFLDRKVWSAATEREATDRTLAGLEELLGRDLAAELLRRLREREPHGSKVVQDIASVFPADAQPAGPPVIHRTDWDVSHDGDTTTITASVVASYDVTTEADQTPVVVGRSFGVLLTSDGDGTSVGAEVDGGVWLADGCGVVADGVLRSAGRLSDRELRALRTGLAEDDPDDPLDVFDALIDVGVGEFTDADQRACLAKR